MKLPDSNKPVSGITGAVQCITSRTLRRKLVADSTSYSAILDDARCTLAIEYLLATRMNTDDIAKRLGFSDSAHFRRAFRRWTGKLPSHIRKESKT
ncbi:MULTISPECIES: AraC family transcriptional regulator [Halomonadaceae]|uniref:AraC family transcriptional regulator n=1 Tax=Vreelandella sp. SM1641 TaxID=3126101 RepID=A0AAU7XKW9_9GAMM|nr:AraC family transcriptional regulator [Halomonas sp. Alg239-R46]